MRLQIANDFDEKLAQLYSNTVTVNLDNKSQMSPKDFFNSMEMIAVNYKATMNLKVRA